MKLKQEVEIDEKKYTVTELSVENIINLINDSFFLKKKEEKDIEQTKQDLTALTENFVLSNILDQLEGFSIAKSELEKMIDLCCDFSLSDLKPLTPSEIQQIIEAFKQVNNPFLCVLKKLQIHTILKQQWQVYLTTFLEKLAI